jgi:hypothetical protein
MPKDQRRFPGGQVTLGNVEIGAAYPADVHPEANLMWAGFWGRHLQELQGMTPDWRWFPKDPSLHQITSIVP